MRATRCQIRGLIKEALLAEELQPLIFSEYEDLSLFNRLANYALTNDIQSALADPDMQTEDGYMWIDEARDHFQSVGTWEGPGGYRRQKVPPGWDEKKAYKFLDDLESAWHKEQSKRDATTHKSGPNAAEREAVGEAFTSGPILPDDIPYINYQPHMSGGAVVALRLTDADGRLGNMETVLDEDDAKSFGTTLQDVMDVLEQGGAKLVKKRKPVKHTPPVYD